MLPPASPQKDPFVAQSIWWVSIPDVEPNQVKTKRLDIQVLNHNPPTNYLYIRLIGFSKYVLGGEIISAWIMFNGNIYLNPGSVTSL